MPTRPRPTRLWNSNSNASNSVPLTPISLNRSISLGRTKHLSTIHLGQYGMVKVHFLLGEKHDRPLLHSYVASLRRSQVHRLWHKYPCLQCKRAGGDLMHEQG